MKAKKARMAISKTNVGPERRYRVTYGVRLRLRGGVTAERAREENVGACDALFFAPILREDGVVRTEFISFDGRNAKPLAAQEIFGIWVLMAELLGQAEELPRGPKRLCQETHEFVQKMRKSQSKEAHA